jgi:GNAT superfamily N-acetyltransferase
LKIGRIGVDKKYQNKLIGSFLIEWASGLAIKLKKEIGIRYISVDAYKTAEKFYAKNSFKHLKKKNKKKVIQ